MMVALLLVALASAVQSNLSAQQRFELSEVVVTAEVTGFETRWAEGERGGLETSVWLTPIETLRGQEPEVLEVVLQGGSLGDVRMEVEDTPHLALDRRYLLNLVRDERGRFIILGGEAGATRVETPGLSPGPTLDEVLEQQGVVQ